MKRPSKIRALILSGVFLAVGIILPFAASHAIGIPGTVLLPMHIPVLLCGLICGPLYGGLCGLILPLLSSILTAMPSMFPMVPIMTGELFTYGTVSGILFCKTPLGGKRWGVYPSMLISMICGRLVYALIFGVLLKISGELGALTAIGALITGIPGIIIQLLLIPAIVFSVFGYEKSKNKNALESAKNLIRAGKATCVVIKDGKILTIASGSGIRPILEMYETGMLGGAIVADKIVGRAAAMIMVLGGVCECHALTMSRGASTALAEAHICASYDSCPDHIINRRGDGICPMEQAVQGISDPQDALLAIKAKLRELAENTER